MQKSVLAFVFTVFTLGLIPSAFAFETLESLSSTGVDPVFTEGYDVRTSSERAHNEFTFRSERLKQEKEEKEKFKDMEGSWRYTRTFQTNMLWDANPDSLIHDPDGELIYSYTGLLAMSRRFEHILFEMGTLNSYADYVENQKKSRYSNSEYIRYNFNMNRLTINIYDNFKPDTAVAVGERTELLPGGEAANTEQQIAAARVFTYSNDLSADVSYALSPKTKLNYYHLFSVFYFPERNNTATAVSNSSKAHTFKPGITYAVTPKVNIFADYAFNTIEYFETRGNSLHPYTHTVNTGFDWKISPKMAFGASLGYLIRDYLTDNIENTGGPVMAFKLMRQLSNKVFATLVYSKSVDQNLDQTLRKSLEEDQYFYGANVTWKISQKLFFSAQANMQTNTNDTNVTRVDPDNSTLFFTRPDEEQEYRWGVALSWTPRKNLKLSAAYEFLNHNASFKQSEYEDQKALLTANFAF